MLFSRTLFLLSHSLECRCCIHLYVRTYVYVFAASGFRNMVKMGDKKDREVEIHINVHVYMQRYNIACCLNSLQRGEGRRPAKHNERMHIPTDASCPCCGVVHIRTCIHIYMQLYIRMHTYKLTRMFDVCIWCAYACMCMMCVCMYVYDVCMHVCIWCAYACMCMICVYACMAGNTAMIPHTDWLSWEWVTDTTSDCLS